MKTRFLPHFVRKEVIHSQAPALILSLNHLANKQLRSSNALYSLINAIAQWIYDVICCDMWLPYSNLCRCFTSSYMRGYTEAKTFITFCKTKGKKRTIAFLGPSPNDNPSSNPNPSLSPNLQPF